MDPTTERDIDVLFIGSTNPAIHARRNDWLLRLGELAVVTSVFPHTGADDGNNLECTVQLRDGLIYANEVFFDRSELLAALGATPR